MPSDDIILSESDNSGTVAIDCTSNSGTTRSIAIVAAVNDDSVLAQNLLRSPWIKGGHVPVLLERGHASASLAYNAALRKTDADIVAFVHQDVYIPRGWDRGLRTAVDHLDNDGQNWAILGVFGKTSTGAEVGRVWSTGLGEIGNRVKWPQPVVSVDELLIVLRRGSGITFDEDVPGYHLYGTDIVQRALRAGRGAYVFDNPVVHNTRRMPDAPLDRSYWRAYRYMARKWRGQLPIPTSCGPLTRFGSPLIRKRVGARARQLAGQLSDRVYCAAPEELSRRLGYDLDSASE